MQNKLIPLAEAPRILLEKHHTEISYRRLYNLILDGKVYAKKDSQSGRWLIPENQIEIICGYLNSKKHCSAE